jgi:hypothetical protein
MTPHELAKSESEHAHQRALFAYCNMAKLHGFEVADYWANGGNLSFLQNSTFGKLGEKCYTPKPVPELAWLHAIHNQGHGDAVRGGRAKAEGVKAGVADIFLPVVKMTKGFYGQPDELKFAGLYIEMKKPDQKPVRETSKGGLSEEQLKFKEFVLKQGYAWHVCYSWQEAVEVIKEYLK